MTRPHPLLVWKLIGIAVAFALCLSFLIDPRIVRTIQKSRMLAKRLKKVSLSTGELPVVFIGNSLLERGLPATEAQISAALTTQASGRAGFRAVNLTIGGGDIQDLQRISDRVFAIRPAVIILQADLIIARPQSTKFGLQRIQVWSQSLRALFVPYFPVEVTPSEKSRRLLGTMFSPAEPLPPPRAVLTPAQIRQRNKKKYDDLQLRRTKALWRRQQVYARGANHQNAKSFIEAAVSKQIKVVAIDTPVGQTASRYAPSGYFQRRAQELSRITRSSGAYYFHFPEILNDDHFRDYRHLSPKGRSVFFHWFIPKIVVLALSK